MGNPDVTFDLRGDTATLRAMLPLSLSWDLFIVVFFAIAMSYVFIVGIDMAVKVIIACYVSVIATEGTVAVLFKLTEGSDELLTSVGIPSDPTLIALGKIFLFSLFAVIFLVRSGVEISYGKDTGSILNIVYTALFGFAVSGMLASTVLTYAAGSGLLSGALSLQAASPELLDATLLQLMIVNQYIWYTLPAFLIIITGLLHSD